MKKTERKTKPPASNIVNSLDPAASPEKAGGESSGHLSLKEIKELIDLVAEKQFNEFELERGSFRLRLQKGAGKSDAEPAFHGLAIAPPIAAAAAAGDLRPVEFLAAAHPAQQAAPEPEEEALHIVTSPIVGTFFRAPSPTSEPFAKIGDQVEAGKTLCIIEAMKLMNEIQSDASGTIARIFVENGQPVEYGQPLFGIKV
jgi:acetyl-CoA carboxylase biotin carboxyl carrier protein